MARNRVCLEEFIVYVGKAGKKAAEGQHREVAEIGQSDPAPQSLHGNAHLLS